MDIKADLRHDAARRCRRPGGPGLKVVGNAATVRRRVISSATDGMLAGTLLNRDLIAREIATAVAEHRKEVA